MTTNVGIDCGQGIIQQHHICVEIYSPGYIQTLLLASRDCNSSFSNLGSIAIWKHFKIR